jgi:hypothetical protein
LLFPVKHGIELQSDQNHKQLVATQHKMEWK